MVEMSRAYEDIVAKLAANIPILTEEEFRGKYEL